MGRASPRQALALTTGARTNSGGHRRRVPPPKCPDDRRVHQGRTRDRQRRGNAGPSYGVCWQLAFRTSLVRKVALRGRNARRKIRELDFLTSFVTPSATDSPSSLSSLTKQPMQSALRRRTERHRQRAFSSQRRSERHRHPNFGFGRHYPRPRRILLASARQMPHHDVRNAVDVRRANATSDVQRRARAQGDGAGAG